ncbi:MAG: Na+/H+ antiporter [Chloroflexi bacterium 13_1_20CM_66_33]|nr:MAG: Na+/H+ antiporter [Chloroflexi bacterium 13_1_20CM_66_33]
MHNFETVLALLVGVTFLALVARRLDIPTPALLVTGGLLVALLPGLPVVQFDPQLVFLVFIPPLLFRASILASYRDARANLRPILLLGVGHVLFVTILVAWVARRVVPGLPWASAFALGAVVSPPDVAAATAFLRRLPLPRRLVIILEGESMINDAAAIVAYRMAVAAAVTGSFSLSAASMRFLYVGAGGIVVGLAVGWLLAEVRRHIHDPEVENTISLLTGYAAYLPAEHLHVSGILAVVATGLYLGRVGPRIVAADTRVQNSGMWDVVVFVLEGLIFIIAGLGLRPVLAGWSGPFERDLVWGAVLVSLTVIVARFVWVFPATYLPRFLSARVRKRDPYPPWQLPAVVSWAGLRGAESLVLAAAIPTLTAAGTPFPGRELIIAITFAVMLVTLLGQGFTLAPLLRWLDVRETGDAERREELTARIEASEAALARLDELATESWMNADALSHTRDRYRNRTRHLHGHAKGVLDGPLEAKSEAHMRLARELLAVERRELLRLRDEGAIGDAVMRRVQRELDYEELLLHHE